MAGLRIKLERWTAVIVTSMALLLGGCAGAGDVAGPAEEVAAPSFGIAEDILRRIEEAEKARIAMLQRSTRPIVDLLKIQYDIFKRTGVKRDRSPLLMCDPQQYVGGVRIIGREGGTVDFGPHRLVIPAGALTRPTVITAEAPPSLHVDARFSPHGTTFLKPPTLTLSYKHCYRPVDFLKSAAIVYIDDAGNISEFPVSRDAKDVRLVTASIWHFSRYAIAW